MTVLESGSIVEKCFIQACVKVLKAQLIVSKLSKKVDCLANGCVQCPQCTFVDDYNFWSNCFADEYSVMDHTQILITWSALLMNCGYVAKLQMPELSEYILQVYDKLLYDSLIHSLIQ